MLLLIGIALIVLGFLIVRDAAHDLYRARWLKASELLTLSDEARDQALAKAQTHEGTIVSARRAIEEQRMVMRMQREAEEALRAEVEDLKRGFTDLYELGVELVAEREAALPALSMRDVQAQIENEARAMDTARNHAARANAAYEQAIRRLINEGGKGAAHTS